MRESIFMRFAGYYPLSPTLSRRERGIYSTLE
jgi:hypothetical protein